MKKNYTLKAATLEQQFKNALQFNRLRTARGFTVRKVMLANFNYAVGANDDAPLEYPRLRFMFKRVGEPRFNRDDATNWIANVIDIAKKNGRLVELKEPTKSIIDSNPKTFPTLVMLKKNGFKLPTPHDDLNFDDLDDDLSDLE